MNKEEEVVLIDSDESAKWVDGISGWCDRHGRFYGNDEDLARWSGATHSRCECGTIKEKSWVSCSLCRDKARDDRYMKMPVKEWDNVGMLYSDRYEEFFSDYDDVYCFIDNEELNCDIDHLHLIICEPQYVRKLDYDHSCDVFADDGSLPDEVIDAINVFNKSVSDLPPLSWIPGKYRLGIKAE